MTKISSPLKSRARGKAVATLQLGLRRLLDQGFFELRDADRLAVEKRLGAEKRKATFGPATRKLVALLQEKRRLEASGWVDERTANALNDLLGSDGAAREERSTREVKGVVRLSDDYAADGVRVSAFDRDLRSEELLGECETDKNGAYRVQYSARQFRNLEKDTADLVVKAFASDGALLAASPVLFNAPASAEIDLTIPAESYQPPSLFQRIARVIEPLLGGLKFEELQEDERHQDIGFLSGETGFDKSVLSRFALAHQLTRHALEAEFWFALLGGARFAVAEKDGLREQIAVILGSLSAIDAATVHKALIRSLNDKEIPEASRAKVAGWVEGFLAFAARTVVSDPGTPTFLKSALDHAGIRDARHQERFALLFNEHRGLTPELLDALEREGSFGREEVADVRTSFRLAEITRGDFSVVRTLKDEFEIREPERVRTLAKLSESQWVSFVKEKHASGDLEVPVGTPELGGEVKLPDTEMYGRLLERQFREAFPTTAYAGGLERALGNGGAHGLRHAEALGRFLERHGEFELLNTRVDEFLEKGIDREFASLVADGTFTQEIKAVQRVFKLAPTFAATDTLLADDLHSAQKVYRVGESEFVRRYAERDGFTRESAAQAWRRAADTYAAVLTVVADLKSLDAEGLPAALKNDNDALAKFPNWNNLFQSGDLCECEHCRSVLSPAAYFAELLMFLKDRRAAKGLTVKEILFHRRPDLGFIELNCENALTPLPYVDVVSEVLEDVVAAGGNDLELTGFTAVPAGIAAAKAAVKAAFDAVKISLGSEFTLSQVSPSVPDRWVVHGDAVTYLLKKKTTPNFFAEILRNTKASAEELRAYPQYVNPKAYEKLREARYPSALPFDLFAEEVRAAFQKCGLQRWDLMRTLRAPVAPTAGDIAAEYFGISADPKAGVDERRQILVAGPTVASQQEVWGETGNPAWLDVVGNVKTFLQRTGLEFNELLALLDLSFINPTGDIVIHHRDSSCDTDKKIIKVLDAAKLDRIHRFLRLWRKLKGWKMWELDLVIRHTRVGNGALDEPFLVKLFDFREVQSRLGAQTTVEQTLALLGNLNTETRFTKLHERRDDALYQDLFLNKKLIKPIDPAFEVASVVVAPPTVEQMSSHHAVIMAALGLRERDLVLLKALTKASDGLPYINDDLTLANLSFLWRHAWLSKKLKLKADEWKVLLKVLAQDILELASPGAALAFLERVDQLKATGFNPDELNWLLTADRSAKAAAKEADAARSLSALRKELQAIQSAHDAAQYGFLTAAPPTDTDSLTTLLASLLQKLNRDESATQFFIATLRDEVNVETKVAGLPAGFDFPPAIKSKIRITYDNTTTMLRFTGLMTAAEQTTLLGDPALAAVTGIATYIEAIGELFSRPRLALKFYEPVFTAPLASLPAAVDFTTLPDAALALKISYDAERRVLRLAGILSKVEKTVLETLSADAAYRSAVNVLATQPGSIAAPDERIWLLDADLTFPMRDLKSSAKDNLATNLAAAATKALTHLSKTLSEAAVVGAVSARVGLTEELTQRLLTDYKVLSSAPVLAHLSETFAATSGVVDYATSKATFDGWYWVIRVAAIWRKWQITWADLTKIVALTSNGQLLDFGELPVDGAKPVAASLAVALLDGFLRTRALLRLRDSLPETDIAFLEVLKKLNDGVYTTAADFAADVEHVNGAWPARDVSALISALDLTYPADYLLAENWERLRRAFYFLESLNAAADTLKAFAAAAMSELHAKTLKDLLRSKFGAETWRTLSAEIQDALRERKRDALTAYLLAQPMPADAPSGKWENTNDLYAHYLLDVEMSACLLTSRLVQGSGSVQLFVQRCFMGLERDVAIKADGDDGDSAWRWWKWMRKYRVWEANRKVFLWPENWIEPELKKDRSQFFKDLQNELLQNEVNQYTVENAFTNYLEKLDRVAQLEVAALYQEDDGDNAIVHVFGRTPGAEPHLYYYRRYDYRQWTPWEKVDVDIEGDYLIPAVVNKRLFLLWPVFTEISERKKDSPVLTIATTASGSDVKAKTAERTLRLQMAVSDYRQGQWTPKRVSKDSLLSVGYKVDILKKHYLFVPIDRSEVDGRFGIKVEGSSLGSDGFLHAEFPNRTVFEISGCQGVPQKASLPGHFKLAIRPEPAATGYQPAFMKWVEIENTLWSGRKDFPENDFTLENHSSNRPDIVSLQLLIQTPWIFKVSPPWHLSYLDKLSLDGLVGLGQDDTGAYMPIGAWLPFFYSDKRRTFFVLPSVGGPREQREPTMGGIGGTVRAYYPDLKRGIRQLEDYFEGQVEIYLAKIDFSLLPDPQRYQLSRSLSAGFPEVPPPLTIRPWFSDEQIKQLMKRSFMRYFHGLLGAWSAQLFESCQFHFKNFYHPFVCDFASLVYNPLKGIPALMSRETQLKDTGFRFEQSYQPTPLVVEPTMPQLYPREVVDFSPDGAYSSYNWELFFHAPLLIANQLSKNQRFEEARAWYHFIFNPVGVAGPVPGGSVMSKYWITKPFFETTDPQYVQQRIENIMLMLAGATSVPGYSPQAKKDLEDQVRDWRTNPFEPHRIANYRTVAYQKTVVMKYLDNLIAWGDYLFGQDSMESINEATQLYVLAAEILGGRPNRIPPRLRPPVESFNELEEQFDVISNALVQVENLIPPLPGSGDRSEDPAPLPMLYFCIPQNDKLLRYWDTVADRLYKIRHCMNIEGVVRQLALFEPPIDPAALVKAVAAGVDISAALAELNAPLPLHRFNVLLQKANEVCNDVKALGGALLAALEKRDAEGLGLLRQNQEIRLLEAVKAVREKQIEEAEHNLAAAQKSKEVVVIRRDYYQNVERISASERLHQEKLEEALTAQQLSQITNIAASVAHIVPTLVVGPLTAEVMFGGSNVGHALQAVGAGLTMWANAENYLANKASINAGHERRWDDWKLQEALANRELQQFDKSIAAAELRIAIAKRELDNQVLQIENAKTVDVFMRSKYTNQELYQWQVGQIAGVYFQSYKLAYDLAKQAERCFRFELGVQDSSYINFGYWDSLKKGLLSGEKLQYDLRRLETAYLEQNRREFELTKHISLALLDPRALIRLRETGRCFFEVPEELFDLDYPGHYFRRIKSVSLTLPCVVGPYTTISCTLRLLENRIRINTAIDGGYARKTDEQGPANDTRFVENNIPVKAIAASNAQNDSGVFELTFRDERYLPFEGAGAVSEWSLELFNDTSASTTDFGKPLRQFDYNSISDAVLHVKYTTREDAGPFKNEAVAHLREYFKQEDPIQSLRMFDLRKEFPSEWHRFMNPTNPASGNVFELEMSTTLFRAMDVKKTLEITKMWLFARCTQASAYTVAMTLPPPVGSNTMTLIRSATYGGLHFDETPALGIEIVPTDPPEKWELKVTPTGGGNLEKDPVEIEDAILVLGYRET